MRPLQAQPAPPVGLRDRKRLQTRDALCHAALDLFGSHGYEATTLDDIAAAVDVSKRTVLRHFSGKEDVLLAVFRRMAALTRRELERRPADETPLTALREATAHALREVARDQPGYRGAPTCLAVLHLVAVTPGLLASLQCVLLCQQDALAAILAAREGLAAPATAPAGAGPTVAPAGAGPTVGGPAADLAAAGPAPVGPTVGGLAPVGPAVGGPTVGGSAGAGSVVAGPVAGGPADPRPGLLVAVHAAAMTVAVRSWQATGPHDLDALLNAVDTCLAQLAPTVTGHWRTPPRATESPEAPAPTSCGR